MSFITVLMNENEILRLEQEKEKNKDNCMVIIEPA